MTNDLNSYHGLSLAADNKTLVSIRTTRTANFWLAAGDKAENARQITSGTGDLVGEVMGLAWTPDRRIVYGSNESGDLDIWSMDASGANQRQLTTTELPDVKPSVSADGRFIVFVSWKTGISHIWRMNLDGSNLKQLTNGAAESYPNIFPDSKFVTFLSAAENKSDLWKISIDGGEAIQISDRWSMTPAVAPDGKLIACFQENASDSGFKISLIPAAGGNAIKEISVPATVFLRGGLHWTVDGHSVRFVDNRGGVSNIWEQPISGEAPKQLTFFTTNRILRLAWTRDNKQLVFERGSESADAMLISDLK